jgi:rsbT co-antagonist protein RsbR
MLTRLSRWIGTLQLHDPIARQQAILVQWMFLGILVATMLAIPVGSLLASTTAGQVAIALATASLIPCVSGAWYLLRQDQFQRSVLLLTISWELCLAVYLVVLGLATSGPILLILALPVTLAGLLTQRSGLLLALAGEFLIVGLIAALEAAGSTLIGFAPSEGLSTGLVFAVFLLGIGLLGILLAFFTGSLRSALQMALQRERELEAVRAGQAVVIDEQTASLRSMLDTVERQKAQLATTVEEMQTQQELIRALSAPILPILTGVLVLPVIGTLDAERAAVLEHYVLKTVESQRAHAVIFDVTGLAVMDVPVADALLRTAAALRLLGARVILVGIRPEVAQTLTMIGRSFQQIVTYANLQEAVQTLANDRRPTVPRAVA